MDTKTVVIFGVFDGIHEGHTVFISEAKTHGDHLVVIVARDTAVEKLKHKLPLHCEADRIQALLDIPEVDRVLLGDGEEDTYNTLKEVNPSVVFLGYDQEALFASISKAMKKGTIPKVDIKRGSPHKPESMHSSILYK
jgi:FAD synthetase